MIPSLMGMALDFQSLPKVVPIIVSAVKIPTPMPPAVAVTRIRKTSWPGLMKTLSSPA